MVEPGETPLQAALRETAEEVGVSAELTGLIGTYLLQGGGWPDIQAYVFTARIVSGEPRIVNPQEIAALAWIPLTGLPDRLPNDVQAALDDLRADRTGQVRTVQRTLNMAAVPLE